MGYRVGVEGNVGMGVKVFDGDWEGILRRVVVGSMDGEAAQLTRKVIKIATKSI